MASRPPDENDDQARNRWLMIQAIRVGGAAMALIGLLMANGRIEGGEVAGYALLIFGLIDFFFVPTILARHWRTPDR